MGITIWFYLRTESGMTSLILLYLIMWIIVIVIIFLRTIVIIIVGSWPIYSIHPVGVLFLPFDQRLLAEIFASWVQLTIAPSMNAVGIRQYILKEKMLVICVMNSLIWMCRIIYYYHGHILEVSYSKGAQVNTFESYYRANNNHLLLCWVADAI